MKMTALIVAVTIAICTTSGVALGETHVKVVASGLNNPRGLAFAADGTLYVAEAGSGGNGRCIAGTDDPTVQRCYGETGAITRVDPDGIQAPHRVIKHLPSMAAVGGVAATSGPVGISFSGRSAFAVMGWGGDPALRRGVGPKSELFGTILRLLPDGIYFPVADISANERRFNPAGGPVDSNPYGILALPGRRIVADAGANAVIEAQGWFEEWPGGKSRDRTLAVLPRTIAGLEPVPTSVAEGLDGYLYVGELTGAPFLRGTANIYRISPEGGVPRVFLSGLTAITDLAFDRAGCLYILEIASGLVPGPGADPGVGNGRLLRKRPGGDVELVLDGLVFPSGLAVSSEGNVFLTNFGVLPDAGQVLRVTVDK